MSMERPSLRYLTAAFRIVLAIVFLVAGGSKLANPWVFVHTVEGYNMLPDVLSRPFGLALPWIEVLIGLYLLVGLFTRVTALASGTLLAVFLVALALQIVRGHTGNCGCVQGIDNPIVIAFIGGNTIGVFDLIRDGILILMALAVALTPSPMASVDAWLAARRGVAFEDDYGMA